MTEISIRTAVQAARQFVTELFPEHGKDTLLEEVEQSQGNWLITLSFPARDVTLFGTRIPNQGREYKTVEVDGVTGEPKSIKIRVLK